MGVKKQPFAAAIRAGKGPLTWPNSSASIISGGMAAQLTGINGLSARSDSEWIERAATSLPVPDSPVSRIEVGSRATRAIVSRTLRAAADSPIRLSRRKVRSDDARNA